MCYDGALNTKNIEVFMTREQTLKYYWETTGVALSDYVEFVLGLIPGNSIVSSCSRREYNFKGHCS